MWLPHTPARRQRSASGRKQHARRWAASLLACALTVFCAAPALANDGSDAARAGEAQAQQAPLTAEAPPAGEPSGDPEPATPAPEPAAPAPEPAVTEAPDTPDPEGVGAGAEEPSAEEETDESGEDAAPAAPRAEVSALNAPPGQTTLRVKKLGTRQADGSVSPLAGARFYASAGTRGGGQPSHTATTPYTCVTDAQGLCDIFVPNRTGGGSGASAQGYWVYEGAAPAGWSKITQIGTGNYDSAKTASNYMMFTGNVSGQTSVHEVPRDSTAYRNPGSNATATTTNLNGIAGARANPGFPGACGLSIAVVFDTSTSINSTEMSQMKAAARGFVGSDGLGGTPSSVALYRFSTTASQMVGLTSIAGSTGQSTVVNRINSLPNSGDGYTNWDDAMRKIAFNGSESYDVVLFLTDGDPTVNGTSGSNVETTIGFRNVEEGAFSANAVKEMTGPSGAGTKVVAVGIGLATNSYLNLTAISGPVAGQDYYTTGFDGLAGKLKEIAQENCGGSLTVVKKTIDSEGQTIEETAGGWEFTASTEGAYIEAPGGNVASLARTTPATGPSVGSVNFPIDLTTAPSRNVRVVETQQTPDWTVDSVSCTGATPTGSAGDFSVSVARNAIVSCTVVNRQAPQEATVQVDKVWIVQDSTGATELIRSHVPARDGDGELPDGIAAQLRLTGPGAAGATDQAWGAVRDGYAAGDETTIDETTTIDAKKLPGCVLASSAITRSGDQAIDAQLPYTPTLAVGANTYEITNIVKCSTKLTLLKQVIEGSGLTPSDWTLTATPRPPAMGDPIGVPGSDTPVPSGPNANTFDVTAGTTYGLSETVADGSPLAFRNLRLEKLTPSGSWEPVAQMSATPALGSHDTYRFVNDAVPAVSIPFTGGVSSDEVGIAGALLAGLAVLLGAIVWRRRRLMAARS